MRMHGTLFVVGAFVAAGIAAAAWPSPRGGLDLVEKAPSRRVAEDTQGGRGTLAPAGAGYAPR
jgi:hypothetical protein